MTASALFKQFKMDTDVEKTGIVLEFGENADGTQSTIRIARAGGANNAYSKRLEAKLKPYRRQIQTETMDRKLLESIVREVFAETCVLGWEHVQDADGTDIAYTRENVVKLLTDLPELYAYLQEQANTLALYRAEINEAVSGN
jgi:hypothetical protein